MKEINACSICKRRKRVFADISRPEHTYLREKLISEFPGWKETERICRECARKREE